MSLEASGQPRSGLRRASVWRTRGDRPLRRGKEAAEGSVWRTEDRRLPVREGLQGPGRAEVREGGHELRTHQG